MKIKIKIYLKLNIIKLNHYKFQDINIQIIVIKIKRKQPKIVINLGSFNKINLLLTCIEIYMIILSISYFFHIYNINCNIFNYNNQY